MKTWKNDDAIQALKNLIPFVSSNQLSILSGLIGGEEGQFFIDMVVELDQQIQEMPKTYETAGMNNVVAYLHYFKGNMDFYIVEKDMYNPQLQAYGLSSLGHGSELGYISIEDVITLDFEIDLYFTPISLAKIKES